MENIVHHLQVIQILISAAAGFIGVGIGVGVFRTSINNAIKQIKEDILEIKRKQAKLRGEDGTGPRYISSEACGNFRNYCANMSEGRMKQICNDITEHTKSIQSLSNFARWWMQKEGLTIDQINKILGT